MSKFTLTMAFDTLAELEDFVRTQKPALTEADAKADLKGEPRPGNATKPAAPKATKPTPPAQARTEQAAKGASTDSSNEGASDGGDAVDYETEVKPLVLKLSGMKGGGREAVLDTLKKFGAAKGSDVPANKLAEFRDELQSQIDTLSVA
jgi:BRCT domain type II-containing protein